MQCTEHVNKNAISENSEPFIYNTCVWERGEPTVEVFMIYAFVVPTFSFFGLCANIINGIVFMRPKMTPSAFTYLAALSWMDCLSCTLITLTAFSRSIFYASTFWMTYDLKWQTPLFGITTGAANLILACVSFDRFIYLWKGIPSGTPSFCRPKIARRMVFLVIVTSIILNLPYFFIFIVNNDGTFQTTDFYYSRYYMVHNWISFILLAVLPAVFLLVGNVAIIFAFKRWVKQSKAANRDSKVTQKRYQHQMKLTISIFIVILLYLVGELPAHLTSRKSALNLLFGGDMNKVDFSLMERLEIICITLNAMQLSLNIVIYALINPSFMPEFFLCLRGASDVCFNVFTLKTIGKCFCCCKGRLKSQHDQRSEICSSNNWTIENHLRTEIRSCNENSIASINVDESTTHVSTDNQSFVTCTSKHVISTKTSAFESMSLEINEARDYDKYTTISRRNNSILSN